MTRARPILTYSQPRCASRQYVLGGRSSSPIIAPGVSACAERASSIHHALRSLIFGALLPLLLSLSVSLSVSGCAPPKPHPAVTAYQELIGGLRYGDRDRVWSLLSVKSRALLLERTHEQRVSNSTQATAQTAAQLDHLKRAPKDFKVSLDWAFESPFATQVKLAESSDSLSDPRDITTQRQGLDAPVEYPHNRSTHQQVTVRAFYASESWQIPVIFEHNMWRVHLLGAHRTPSPSRPIGD